MDAAVAALIGAALGFSGSLAVSLLEQRYKRSEWLREKQSKLYDDLVDEVIAVAERRATMPTSPDLSRLKALLYRFIRMYFAAGVPYRQRPDFFKLLREYAAALQSGDRDRILDQQGTLVNHLSDVARGSLGLPDAEFKL